MIILFSKKFDFFFFTIYKTNTNENYSKPTPINNVYKGQKEPRKAKIKKQSKDKIIRSIVGRKVRDAEILFEPEEDYYKPVGIGNFHSKHYTKCESNGDRNATL